MDNLTFSGLCELVVTILDNLIEFTYDPRDRLTREEIIGRVIDHLKNRQILAAVPKRLSLIVTGYFNQKNNVGFYTHVNYVKKFVFAGIRWKTEAEV